MPICDGCSVGVDAQHIRQRIERLELATRFRPVHIQVLLLDEAPPARMEDYFYQPAQDSSIQSSSSAQYHDQLLKCAGLEPKAGDPQESQLSDFQRRGFFLAYAVECPVESKAKLEDALRRSSGTLVKRMLHSYRPKKIALLFQPGQELASTLEGNGLSDRLILDAGQSFDGLDFGVRLRDAIAGLS
jgi:hypothetical protein